MKEEKAKKWAQYDLFCISRYVIKNLWIICLGALIGVMLMYLVLSLFISSSYTSQVSFAVTSRDYASSSFGNTVATHAVAAQMAELLMDEPVQKSAAEKLNLKSFPAELAVRSPENTNLIVLGIRSSSPELAYKSALAIIASYDEFSSRSNVLKRAVLNNINGPTIAAVPNDQSLRTTLLTLSAPLGALIMTAVLVMMSIQADTVQTPEGAKLQLEGKLLSTVFHERNNRTLQDILKPKKKSLLITNPTCSFYYTETIHQIRVTLERAHESEGAHVFVITSCSENEGKSTIAANLALSLAQKHQKVLLLDADLRKPAQNLIFETKVERNQSFASFLTGDYSEEEMLKSVVYSEATNLHFFYSRSLRRKKAESLSAEEFQPALEALRKQFSYIIVDTPPLGLFSDAEIIADVADASILVVRQDQVPALSVNDAIDILMESNSIFLGYILNNVRSFRAIALPGSSGYSYGYGFGYGYGYGNYGYSYGHSKKPSVKKAKERKVHNDG